MTSRTCASQPGTHKVRIRKVILHAPSASVCVACMHVSLLWHHHFIGGTVIKNEPGHAHAQQKWHRCAGVTADNVRRGVEYALQQRNLGKAVLVHCAHGHGRSAEVLLGCMIASGLYKTHEEGLAAYKLLRKKCKLNKAQRRHLETYLEKVVSVVPPVSTDQ
jgi:hypothetical protein